MSQADRDKWNTRYRDGGYGTRTQPSAFLAEWLPRLGLEGTELRAIDAASGTGRNALYLARRGWRVDAIDISEVGLDRLRDAAIEENLSITCIRSDLEQASKGATQSITADRYDLAILFRYTNLALLEVLSRSLTPGGYLIVEGHLVTQAEVVGPQDTSFRVAPDALRAAATDLNIIEYREGLIADPDGRRAALAQLVARKSTSAD